MPDLTVHPFGYCSTRKRFVGINGYQIDIVEGTCSCKGFMYRGACKHLVLAAKEVCSWSEFIDEPPTADDRCPKCGSAIEYEMVAV